MTRLAVGLLLALGLMACAPADADVPLVAVSTTILGDVVTEVVGDQAEVLVLMPPGADPHGFEASAALAERIRGADLLVSNGLRLEEGLQAQLDAAADEGVPTLVAGDVIDVLTYAGGDAAGSPDPHFWTDPTRMVPVVEALVPALSAVPEVDAAVVAGRAAAYVGQLEALDRWMAERFAAVPEDRRALVTNHHVFGYLAERYDLTVIGAVIPSGTTLASPSSADLADLVAAIDATGVPAIFAESSSPDRLVQVLADEAALDVGVHTLFSESLTGPDGEAPDYLTMMRINTERIADGLSS